MGEIDFMKIRFLQSVDLDFYHFKENDILCLDNDEYVQELNEEYYILLYKGLRFDLHKIR